MPRPAPVKTKSFRVRLGFHWVSYQIEKWRFTRAWRSRDPKALLRHIERLGKEWKLIKIDAKGGGSFSSRTIFINGPLSFSMSRLFEFYFDYRVHPNDCSWVSAKFGWFRLLWIIRPPKKDWAPKKKGVAVAA